MNMFTKADQNHTFPASELIVYMSVFCPSQQIDCDQASSKNNNQKKKIEVVVKTQSNSTQQDLTKVPRGAKEHVSKGKKEGGLASGRQLIVKRLPGSEREIT
jgi:hypothetical protein